MPAGIAEAGSLEGGDCAKLIGQLARPAERRSTGGILAVCEGDRIGGIGEEDRLIERGVEGTEEEELIPEMWNVTAEFRTEIILWA